MVRGGVVCGGVVCGGVILGSLKAGTDPSLRGFNDPKICLGSATAVGCWLKTVEMLDVFYAVQSADVPLCTIHRPLTQEEIAQRRELVKQRRSTKAEAGTEAGVSDGESW